MCPRDDLASSRALSRRAPRAGALAAGRLVTPRRSGSCEFIERPPGEREASQFSWRYQTERDTATLGLPRGFRDILPTEAREVRSLERTLMDVFASYGYVPLEPPIVEHAAGLLAFAEGRVLQFLDRDGRLVALRPDATTAVARVVAQHYREATGALRLAYFAPVFREEPAMLGGEREFDQAGAELVGPTGALADAEILALLADALSRCGLRGARIEVGHVGVVRRLFDELAPHAAEATLAALRAGDLVGAFRHAGDGGMSRAALERARAGLAARGRSIEAVDIAGAEELRQVILLARELVAEADRGRFGPNLALVPELPYYTGIVFEAIHAEAGFPVASGGRYDLLLGSFGDPRPATGFAINVPRLHLALYREGWRPPDERALVSLRPSDDARDTLRLAAALRAAGVAVAIGDVAESAGRPLLVARVVDGARVQLADGRIVSADRFARELGG